MLIKKIKIRVFKTTNILLSALISLLGFSSACSIGTVEYGAPHADFIVSGKTESAVSGEAVENIRVVAMWDTSFTNDKGLYLKELETGGAQDGELVLKFEDIDGEQNGSFEPLDTLIQYKASDFEGGDDNWYGGKATKTVNVKLRPKK
jgi:putative lipoprotein (rSAM/lipoprotein system)